MKHVIDVANGDAQVLTETGDGGLIGRGLLHDRPLAEYVEPAETPRFVVRNRKRGFTVERTDGTADRAVETGQIAPDGDHSAAALVTDTRVLLAVGRAAGDRTRSVPLAEVVDARTEAGLLNGTLVVDTVEGLQYRVPSRGDLEAVREFVDAAAGVWSRAERHLERAGETLDKVERAFEAGDVDVVLAAVGDVGETLAEAEAAASALDGAAASVGDRADRYRERLAGYERRAYAEQAEQARERGHTRWEDEAYETAADHFERAAESYAAALSVDADRPSDDLVERRRANLAAERERLAAAPLERAEQAVEVARTTDDAETAVAWWERALERYERLRSLDWGREDLRFEGDREAIRERLATVAERLVDARCERAAASLDAAEGAPPAAAAAACERAASSLDAARAIARERVPDALDAVEALDERLEERRPDPSAVESSGDADAEETVVVPSDAVDDRRAESDADAVTEDGVDTATESDADTTTEPAPEEGSDGDWTLADDGTDDEWLSGERIANETDADDAGAVEEATAEGSDEVITRGGAQADSSAAAGADDPSTEWAPAVLSSLDGAATARAVAEWFRATGWTVEAMGDDAGDGLDIRAVAPGPGEVSAGVLAVPAEAAATLDGAAIERLAAAVDRAAGPDAAVVVAGATLPREVRERAEQAGASVVSPETFAAELDDHDVDPPDSSGSQSDPASGGPSESDSGA